MTIYVIADQDDNKILSSTYSLIGAAKSLSDSIILVCYGKLNPASVGRVRKSPYLIKVIHIKDLPNPLPQDLANALTDVLGSSLKMVVGSTSIFVKEVLGIISALQDIEIFSNISAIDSKKNIMMRRVSTKRINVVSYLPENSYILTVIPHLFFDDHSITEVKCLIENISAPYFKLVTIVNHGYINQQVDNLECASLVVTAGGALVSASDIRRLELFAEKIRAKLGATYAPVVAGHLDDRYLIGSSGQLVKPRLYIGFGVSGSLQHMAGIDADSLLVAVNNDPKAEIFRQVDFGLLLDWEDALSELECEFA